MARAPILLVSSAVQFKMRERNERIYRVLAAPLWSLAALLVLATTFCVLLVIKGGEISKLSAWLYNAAFAFLVAWAVELDRKALGVPAPFEYSAFMFFLWWVLLPVYLFKTRRWRGLAIALVVLFLSSLPSTVAFAVYAFLGNSA